MDDPALEEHKDGRYVLLLVKFEFYSRDTFNKKYPPWNLIKPHLGKWCKYGEIFELGEPCDGQKLLGWMPIPPINKVDQDHGIDMDDDMDDDL